MESTTQNTILVVDDTPENIDILNGLLQKDYKIKVAVNGKIALKICQSPAPPDIVLLDIMMPEMDGYEVCSKLKESEKTKNIPVIFLTAKDQAEDEAKGFSLGAVDYIKKPFNPIIVQARVKTHLAVKNSEEQLKEKNLKLKSALEELKQAQAKMIQAEKMAALGQLIAGIAHEINTPLGSIRSSIETVITSFSSFTDNMFQLEKEDISNLASILDLISNTEEYLSLKEKRELSKRLINEFAQHQIELSSIAAKTLIGLGIKNFSDSLKILSSAPNSKNLLDVLQSISFVKRGTENIQLAAEKVSKIIFALKKFTHFDTEAESKTESDIPQGIHTVLTLYQNQLKQGVEVVTQFEKVPMINCYPDELIQVWTNLIHNALQAMGNQGVLKVMVKMEENHLIVSVQDSGSGIPENIQEKIFEPFFTTKASGEGSGLGLDIVKRIIDKHDGSISFQTEIDKGTTFYIKLPLN